MTLLPFRPTEDSIGLPLDLRADVDADERRRRIQEQAGPPMEVYGRPRTLAVARFVGEPEIGVVRTELDGRPVDLGIRPHELRTATPGAGGTRFHAAVVAVEVLGRRALATLEVDGGVLRWDRAPVTTRVGDLVDVVVDPGRVHLFDPGTGVAVGHPE